MKYFITIIFAAAVIIGAASVGTAGEYHTGGTLLCYDCHTMHYSMQHGFAGGSVANTPAQGGNWLGTTGPNQYLLKAPANQLCLSCHDGQPFAPDVFGINANASPSQGREAGALNDTTGTAPYYTWTGHTLGSTNTPPGYDPAVVGLSNSWYTGTTDGLECINCHAQHGPAGSYRNLGSYALGATAGNFRPSYVISTTDDTTKDVWINLASYTAGLGSAATFDPYYDRANINFNRIDAAVGTAKTSNKIGTFCGSCHGDFHGGPGDTGIGATSAALDGFIRHPNAQVTIGASGGQGYGGHSSLSRYTTGATTRVKVAASDQTGFTDASPMCLTCHKAHGNQNPFGLIFLNRNATALNDEGGYATGQTQDLATGYRNLCGQCHGQGNS